MRLLGLALTLFVSALLGLAVGVAAVFLHRSTAGLVLGLGTTVLTMRALRHWAPPAVIGYAVGWLAVLLAALGGRAEGDLAVATDTVGWVLVGGGLVVLVTAILWARPHRERSSSGSLGGPA
jgi:hypothetical protein